MGPRPGDVVGPYRLDRVLGVGGMGVVFAATDVALGRPVAVKVLSGALAASPDFRARFDREATLLARLESPHVIGIFDHGEHGAGPDAAPYLVTRLVRGGDLGALLRERGPLPPAMALAVGSQVAEALRDAHRVGIVHRDVKPANVLVRDPDAPELFVHLADFGIATGPGNELTRPGSGVSGTWGYLSPERLGGRAGSPSSDVYALGCLVWACLTGRPPYAGTDYAVARAHRDAPVPRLGLPGAVGAEPDDLLGALLAKSPDARPDAEGARAGLASLAGRTAGLPAATVATEEDTTRPAGAGAASRTAAPRRRGRVLLATGAALVLLVLAGVAGTAYWTGADEPAPSDPTADGGASDPAPDPTVAGDRDGDGDADLLVQARTARTSERLGWTSDGTALQPDDGSGADTGTAGDGAPVAGDLDGDGRQDVLLRRSEVIETRFATGERRQVPETGGVELIRLAPLLADVDGDGRQDYVEWGVDLDAVIRMNVAMTGEDGTLGPLEERRIPAFGAGTLEVGDFDGDGSAEPVLLSQRPDGGGEDGVLVRLLAARGDRYVVASSTSTALGTAAVYETGDPDGDGVDELVVRAEADQERELRVIDLADGTDEVWYDGDDLGPMTRREGTVVADYDADGRDDVLVTVPDEDDDGVVDLAVLMAGENGFEEPTGWATWRCDDACRSFRIVTATGPQRRGFATAGELDAG